MKRAARYLTRLALACGAAFVTAATITNHIANRHWERKFGNTT